MKQRKWFGVAVVCFLATVVVRSQGLDYGVLTRIQDEGLHRSQAMETISWISDVYGPRLTGSPGFQQAADWITEKLKTWELSNVRQQRWPFGKGWSLIRFSAQMTEPQVSPLIGFPKSWTPGTKGPVTAEVVRVAIDSEADFSRYRGKLAGKIVLTQPAREVEMLDGRIVWRMDDEMLREAEKQPIPPTPLVRPGGAARSGPSLQEQIAQFFLKEGVVAAFDRGSDASRVAASGMENLPMMTQRTDGGTVFVGAGGPRDEHAGEVVPTVTLAVEHYNRMIRILDKGTPVKVELNIQAQFHDEPAAGNGMNVLADLPGTDLADEIVLLGAHLDSHHSGTGATDNAAGVATMMEVLRILKTIGARPRRTIRIGLWGGEEHGYMGSRAYVREFVADRATMTLKPEHQRLSAYYNFDNGTGRIRGVWMQDNLAVAPIFRAWIEPLRPLGVMALSPRAVSGSDYVSFDEVGIPAFQFIQDRLEYNARTHHSNMDVVDRVQADDVMQAAVVVASFAYHTAMRDEKLPRKALPAGSHGSR